MCQLDQLPTSWCRCPLETEHCVMSCLHEITYFLSCSLLHLICFNLFHLISWSPFLGACVSFRHLCLCSRNSRWLALANQHALPSLLARRQLRSQKHGRDPRRNICIVILTQIHMKRLSTFSVVGISVQSIFKPCQLLGVDTLWCFQLWSELDVSHNAVVRYPKRFVQCFGRVQCAMASCSLVQEIYIYIAFQVSIFEQFSFAVRWRIPCFLLYLYARQHLVLRYSRMPLELTRGSKREHLAVSHQAREKFEFAIDHS